MIQEYLLEGTESGVSLSCDVECRILTGLIWKEQLSVISNSIVFVDEGNRFVRTKEFAESINGSDNYYVIVSRECLDMLPISVNEIYGIRSSGKYGGLEPVYHELYHIYSGFEYDKMAVFPDEILVEDSNSGFDFFDFVSKENGIHCESSYGKSKIYSILCNRVFSEKKLLVVADGAAFGSQMNRIKKIYESNKNICLYLPESFEWLLLSAGLFSGSDLNKILNNPSNYIESKDYFSWEQYFTSLLIEISKDHYLKYSKNHLNSNYLKPTIVEKIKSAIKGIVFIKHKGIKQDN